MALEGWDGARGTAGIRRSSKPAPGPRPGRRVACGSMLSGWQNCPLEIRAPGRGQLRPDVRRQLDPRDGPVGLGKIGGGDARGDRGPAQRPRAGAATASWRSDREPAQPEHRREGIGAHAHQVDAIGRLVRQPAPARCLHMPMASPWSRRPRDL